MGTWVKGERGKRVPEELNDKRIVIQNVFVSYWYWYSRAPTSLPPLSLPINSLLHILLYAIVMHAQDLHKICTRSAYNPVLHESGNKQGGR